MLPREWGRPMMDSYPLALCCTNWHTTLQTGILLYELALYSTQWHYTLHIGTQLYTLAIYSSLLSVPCSVPCPLAPTRCSLFTLYYHTIGTVLNRQQSNSTTNYIKVQSRHCQLEQMLSPAAGPQLLGTSCLLSLVLHST